MEHPLRRYRKAKGLTIEALAERISSSRATISRIEAGLQEPSFGLMRRIMAETEGEVTANDFVNWREPASPSEAAE
jgi:transcriptional regulator with XRE-family HTH domain